MVRTPKQDCRKQGEQERQNYTSRYSSGRAVFGTLVLLFQRYHSGAQDQPENKRSNKIVFKDLPLKDVGIQGHALKGSKISLPKTCLVVCYR